MNKVGISPSLKSDYPKKIFLGMADGECIFLYAPSWDCGWYWGFGYIGNNHRHYHLSGLTESHGVNLYDAINKEFNTGHKIKDLWKFCEIVKTIYSLRDISKVYHRGGTHFSNNPCKELITNLDEYIRINTVLIPELIDEMYKCF